LPRYQSIFLGAVVGPSALRDVPGTGVTFDGRGNEVEGNKGVIELAVYIALRRTSREVP